MTICRNDAYYTLSEITRRRDYDDARRFHGGNTFTFDDEADEEVPRPPPQTDGAGSSWANMFGFGQSAGGAQQQTPFADRQFQSAFEEMMAEENLADKENKPTPRFWTIVGGVSGAALGFIVGNFVGAVTGGVAGSKAGGIRDAKGKSVYEVFQTLEQGQKARLLSELAAKLFSGAIS